MPRSVCEKKLHFRDKIFLQYFNILKSKKIKFNQIYYSKNIDSTYICILVSFSAHIYLYLLKQIRRILEILNFI